ncbi:MAG: YjjI family glycine radical enzyme, partial [Spirochaetales bacterium]|nr:YjjI family glycine radical enzyme [Candidatus Physcosoma equi]
MRTTPVTAEEIMAIIKDPTLSRVHREADLAQVAERLLMPYELPEETLDLLSDNSISDMGEPYGTYKCRYAVPDYDLFMKKGSKALRLPPPSTIWEAVNWLMILYQHTSELAYRPHYVGHLDRLLDPFIKDEKEAMEAIRHLLMYLDRVGGDSFVHANIGPEETKAGRIILSLTREMQEVIPGLTLCFDEEKTSEAFALDAFRTAMVAAKPSFANDRIYREEMGRYAIASCYNALPLGGCGMTLNRLMLHNLSTRAESPEDFLNNWLPRAVRAVADMMDRRIIFMVEECGFVENNFLYKEGLLKNDRDHMVAMLGFVGLAEAVNHLLSAEKQCDRFGHSEKADSLGEAIMDRIAEEMGNCQMKYGVLRLHAQVGNGNDTDGMSPGGRIPVGEEPPIPEHIRNFIRMHKDCQAGCGELFRFEPTVKKNLEFLLDILKGAFQEGARYLSFYASDSDLVRVTGYLVKRSDIEKFR